MKIEKLTDVVKAERERMTQRDTTGDAEEEALLRPSLLQSGRHHRNQKRAMISRLHHRKVSRYRRFSELIRESGQWETGKSLEGKY